MLRPAVGQRKRSYRTRLRAGAWLMAALALALSVAPAPAAQAQDGDAAAQAKEHFQAGVTAYEVGDFPGALKEFQEAFRLKPHPMVRVNMANCYDNLDKPVEAIFHFEKFMVAPEGTPEQRKEVRDALRRLRQRVGEVSIRVTPDGALVQIDDEETRKAPIQDAVLLKAGAHTIRASLDGYATVERTVDVLGGQPASVDITLEPASAAAVPLAGALPAAAAPVAESAPPAEETVDVSAVAPLSETDQAQTEQVLDEEPAPDEAPSGGRRLTTAVVVAGSVTIALAVAATVTGIMALGANGDFDDAAAVVNDPNATTLERHDAYADAESSADKAEAMALTTDLLLIGALVGAGVTTVLYLTSGSSGESAGLKVRPALARKAGGLVVSGSF
jgi:hypothetical protein